MSSFYTFQFTKNQNDGHLKQMYCEFQDWLASRGFQNLHCAVIFPGLADVFLLLISSHQFNSENKKEELTEGRLTIAIFADA